MANKKFTEQEILTLRNSKYVLDVSPSIVHFSAEFKKLFWEELSKGRLPREIVLSFGIDPNILGDSRLNGLKTMIGNEDKNTMRISLLQYKSCQNRLNHSACKRPPILLSSSAEAVFEISNEKESFQMITSGLNAVDDTADCSGNLNSTKSTDGFAGILTALTAGSEDSTVEIYASSRSRRCQ